MTSRIAIEQAKGIVGESLDIGMDEAFDRLRRYSRSTNARLSDVAADVVRRRLDVGVLSALPPRTT